MDKTVAYEQASKVEQVASASDSATGSDQQVTWRDFVTLAKPGILISNSITVVGGFWLAAKWEIDLQTLLLLVYTLLGTILVMASGCVLNNYLDREMDTKMSRTQKRALPSGRIHPQVVLAYGISLGVLGLIVLQFLVGSPLCTLLGLIGMFVYVWIYTAWLKRSSVWSTTIGAISGAVPPVIGYCAVSNQLDMAAFVLFMILFLWQPPHFWALGIRRKEEYRAAGFNILPVVQGSYKTKISMMRYVVPLVPVSLMLYHFQYVGIIYMVVALAMGLYWVYLVAKGFRAQDDESWSKKVFFFSLFYLTFLFLVIVLDTDGALSNLIGL